MASGSSSQAFGGRRPPIELLIFDCDGVLVDTDRIAFRLQSAALAGLGWHLTFQECARAFLGLGAARSIQLIEQHFDAALPAGWWDALQGDIFDAFARELEPIAGISDALDRIQLPMCVASSGTHEKMSFTLGHVGLLDRFADRLFSGTDVPRGKPAPDLFLHAARTLGALPERCAVVEDSPAGVQAARAAGMRAFGYAALTPAAWLQGPDTVVFDDMSLLPDVVEKTDLLTDRDDA